MPARIPAAAILPDLFACMGLGFALALLRCLLPGGRHSRVAFWTDFFAAGAALVLAQSFAAAHAAAGELRWYHLAAGAVGATAACSLLQRWLAALRAAVLRPLQRAAKRLVQDLHTGLCRLYAKKSKKRRNKARKNPKKQLQTGQRVLYNSNVS